MCGQGQRRTEAKTLASSAARLLRFPSCLIKTTGVPPARHLFGARATSIRCGGIAPRSAPQPRVSHARRQGTSNSMSWGADLPRPPDVECHLAAAVLEATCDVCHLRCVICGVAFKRTRHRCDMRFSATSVLTARSSCDESSLVIRHSGADSAPLLLHWRRSKRRGKRHGRNMRFGQQPARQHFHAPVRGLSWCRGST